MNIVQDGESFQCRIVSALDGPFVVLFEQDGTDNAGNGRLIRDLKGRAANV